MNNELNKQVIPPDYSPSDMVRMEILAYDNPEGLHPVGEAWRNLARKLIKHVGEVDRALVKAKPPYGVELHKPFRFPGQFEAKPE